MSFISFASTRAAHHKALGLASVLAVGLVAFTTSAVVWADAEVSVPENVVVLGIDGQETGNTGLFSKKHTTIKLAAGEHTITARYDRLFPTSGGDYDIVRSKGVTVRATFADQQTYTLGWQAEPDDHDAAVTFAKQPTLLVKAAGGQVIASQKGLLTKSPTLLSTVIQGYSNLTTSDEGKTDALQHLQSLWGQATTEQRKQFKQWLAQQPDK